MYAVCMSWIRENLGFNLVHLTKPTNRMSSGGAHCTCTSHEENVARQCSYIRHRLPKGENKCPSSWPNQVNSTIHAVSQVTCCASVPASPSRTMLSPSQASSIPDAS